MANKIPGITIEGDSELGALLKSLPGTLLSEVEMGMKEFGKIVVKAAQRRLVPGHGYDTGALKKSLGIKFIKKYPREDRVVMYVGPRRNWSGVQSIKKKHDPQMIAHLVEFGHGTVPAKPFLRPAIDENKTRFNSIMITRIKRVLELRAARAAKKAAA